MYYRNLLLIPLLISIKYVQSINLSFKIKAVFETLGIILSIISDEIDELYEFESTRIIFTNK